GERDDPVAARLAFMSRDPLSVHRQGVGLVDLRPLGGVGTHYVDPVALAGDPLNVYLLSVLPDHHGVADDLIVMAVPPEHLDRVPLVGADHQEVADNADPADIFAMDDIPLELDGTELLELACVGKRREQ